MKNIGVKVFFQLFSDSFEYLCYGSTAIRNMFNPYSAGIDFSRQNLTFTDVRSRRLKSIPALKGLTSGYSLFFTFLVAHHISAFKHVKVKM